MELNFKDLTIDDMDIFNKFFKEHPPLISEFTFSNLFSWKNSRRIKYSLYNEGLIILAEQHGEYYFMPPVGFTDHKKIYSEIFNYALKNSIPAVFKRAGEDHASHLKDAGYKITEDPKNFDYVYNTDDLAFLNGRKYSNKRAWVRKFEEEYYHKYLNYTEECKSYCIKLAEKWLTKRENDDKQLIDEFDAIKCFLDNYKYFNIPGGMLCVECDNMQEIAAFTFGEKLNNETFVIHFEKAEYEKTGAYQAINKFFAENEIAGKYKYINREQDLGIAGLIKAKHSYYPAGMVKKYIITPE